MSEKLPTYLKQDFGAAIVPLEYAKALKALKQCQTIDDAKQWAGKAEALAAWAKIYKHDEAGKEARRLKLHAYRKMGELAEALRPTPKPGNKGQRKGASSLLREHGLSSHKSREALNLSRARSDEFSEAVTQARGISVTAEQFRGRGRPAARPSTDTYHWLMGKDTGVSTRSLLAKLQGRDPREVALALRPDERERARTVALAFVDWFDELDRCIPKMVKDE